VVNPLTLVREVKLTDVAQWPIEQVTVCCIPFSVEPLVTIASSSLSTLLWILSWRATNAEELWLTIWLMELFIE